MDVKKIIALALALNLSWSFNGFGQAPPNFNDDFLDDDFEPPPGTPMEPPNQGQTTFGDSVNQNNNPGSAGGAKSPGGSGGARVDRSKRKTPPNLLSKRPPNMAEATDKDITDENFPDLIDSFDYPNAEIADLVKAMSELTGKNFIIDPSVKGKISIIAPTRITVAEAYKAFLSALAINQFTVVPSGKFLKVRPAQQALRDNLDTYSGNFSPSSDAMITRIIQLRYISAKEIFNSLGQAILVSRSGDLRAYEPTNTLIISDYGSNVDRVMKILRQLDVPGFEEQLEVIRVKYAKATEIAKLVDQIINKGKPGGQGGSGSFTSGIPRFTPLGGQQGGSSDPYSLIIPDERTNALILVGNTQGIIKIKKLVQKLDFRIKPEEAGGVYVYYVKYGDAEKIAQTLSGLVQSASAAPGGGKGPSVGLFGGDVKITSDKTSNSLIVTAPKQDYEVVRAILGKLDVARDQVYVEGVYLELRAENTKSWGINFYNLFGKSFAGRAGFVSDSGAVSNILDPSKDLGLILPFASSGTVQVPMPGSTGGSSGTPLEIPSLVGFINFLSTIASVNILSTPQIIALDNEEAEIEVGSKVPTATTQNAGTATQPASISVTREDVSIKLNVKPHISPGANSLRLEIKQEISEIGTGQVQAKNLNDNAIITTKRNTKTNVMVRNGDTIVLGGLMKDNEDVNITKIPLLGDIPIIGWLFKGKRVQKVKTNLMMFLTPRIIRSSQDAANLLTDKIKQRVNFIEKNMGGKDSHGEDVDKIRLKRGDQTVTIKPDAPK